MTVSDIQRWTEVLDQTDPYSPNPDMREADYGSYVTYADHVAAVAAAERQSAEYATLVGAAAESAYAQGVKDARDAVAALRAPGYEPWGEFIYREVLPAIDALRGGS